MLFHIAYFIGMHLHLPTLEAYRCSVYNFQQISLPFAPLLWGVVNSISAKTTLLGNIHWGTMTTYLFLEKYAMSQQRRYSTMVL